MRTETHSNTILQLLVRRTIVAWVMAIIGFLLTVPSEAVAQSWLKDRSSREGPGMKVGKTLVLHMGLGVEGGYDSNATYEHDAVQAGRLRIAPYIDLATRSEKRDLDKPGAAPSAQPKALFRLGLAGRYDRYFAKDSAATKDFNAKFNPIGFDTHLDFTLFPERKASFLGGVTYIKTLEPYESASDAQSKHQVVPMAALRLIPGGGTLTIEPKYRLNLLVFDDPRIGRDSNRFIHEVSCFTNWKILPKTALISNVMFSPTVYFGEMATNVDSYPLRSWFGIQGLLLEKFGFRALLGYGVGFYEYGPDFEGFIGDGALMFYFSHFSKATIGMKRDFVDSFYANFYVMNGGYARYEHMFAGRLLLSAEISVYKRIYSQYAGYIETVEYILQASTDSREDIWLTAGFFAEFRAADWLSFHFSAKVWRDVTDFTYQNTREVEGEQVTSTVAVDFSKAEIFGGVRIHY